MPFQETVKDREALHTAVHEAAMCRIQLSVWTATAKDISILTQWLIIYFTIDILYSRWQPVWFWSDEVEGGEEGVCFEHVYVGPYQKCTEDCWKFSSSVDKNRESCNYFLSHKKHCSFPLFPCTWLSLTHVKHV